jgi:hypothetical protein
MNKIFQLKNVPLMLTIFFVATCAIGIYWWFNRPIEPFMTSHCIRYDRPGAGANCLEKITFRIPAVFFSSPTAKNLTLDNGNQIEVAYPNMRPWRELSWTEQWSSHKIEFYIHGVINTPIDESFYPPNYVHQPENLFGLDAYLDTEFNSLWHLRPLDKGIETIFDCHGKGEINKAPGQKCGGWMYLRVQPASQIPTEFKLSIHFTYEELLLPNWKEIDSKLQTLIRSFVITP